MNKISGKNPKQIFLYISVYTSASILGPLILFGGIGYLFDRMFDTKPVLLIIGVFVAFISSNFFLYKKAIYLTKQIKQFAPSEKKDSNDKNE